MSAYQVGIRTNSDDENAVLLLAEGQLVAVLVELADEGHGEERGNWVIEAIFGLQHGRIPQSFPSAANAAAWISANVAGEPIIPMCDLIQLPEMDGSLDLSGACPTASQKLV